MKISHRIGAVQKLLTRLSLIDVPGLRAQGNLHKPSMDLIESFLKDKESMYDTAALST